MLRFKPGDRVVSTNVLDHRVYTFQGTHARFHDWCYLLLKGPALDPVYAGVLIDAHAASIMPLLPLALDRVCPYCYRLSSTVRVRQLCTNYGGDYDLLDSCQSCFDDYNGYYADLIADREIGYLS